MDGPDLFSFDRPVEDGTTPWDLPWPEGAVVADDGTTPERRAAVEARAALSPCGTWRYVLRRRWGPGPVMVWVMLNPSRADGKVDDHTIRRCVALAKRDGFDAIVVINLYAYRTPYPAELDGAADAVGPANDAVIAFVLQRADAVVAAWGGDVRVARRLPVVLAAARGKTITCLGTTTTGAPRHPSRVARDATFVPYDPPSAA